MENRINVAKLLKDCPKGMELDCTIYDNVEFEGISDNKDYPIKISVEGYPEVLNPYGCISYRDYSKCVIFTKGKTTWEGFQRPFKDGDIVTWCDRGSLVACIYKERKNTASFNHHIALFKGGLGIVINGEIALTDDELSFATEEKKAKLFQAIKDNGYKWNTETKNLEKLIKSNKEETMKEKLEQITLDIPNGYEFFGINDENKVVLAKKQQQYPKTYEECCKVLGYNQIMPKDHILGYMGTLLSTFQQLLICRDAYWKITGDWKPNLGENFIYAIGTYYGTVEKRLVTGGSGILLFPTEEMRDAFYENFKELIESCKKLL